MVSGPNFEFRKINDLRSYTTFGPKIPVFRANSCCLLGTKWQKRWLYKNVSRIVQIVQIVHSAVLISATKKDYFIDSEISKKSILTLSKVILAIKTYIKKSKIEN